MKKSYDEIIQQDDRTRRDVVNAVLIFIIETHEAPHLLVKFKLLATSGDSNEHSKSCMKSPKFKPLKLRGSVTRHFSSSASPVRVPSKECH
jgi:hypothetical protein